MTAHKRYTNSQKTKYTWCFVVDIPSGEYDSLGREKRKQKTKSGFATKKEALEAEKKFLDSLRDGNIELNSEATFDNVIQYYFDYASNEGRYSEGTINNYKGFYKNHLQIFHNIKVSKITQDFVRSWLRQKFKDSVSVYTINDSVKFLKASFNYAKKMKKISCNPFEDIERLEEPTVFRNRFSTTQLKALYKSCEENMRDFYCIFVLATSTGMRVGEYSALTPQDFKFDTNEVFITKQYTKGKLIPRNKTKKSTRIAHPSRKTMEIVKWHIKEFGILSGYLFRDSNGNPVSAKWVSRRFKALLKLNGYSENFCRVHDLRGQYVDVMHTMGVPLVYTSKEIGHSTVKTTEKHYTQILNEVSVEATDGFDKIMFS